VGVSVPGGDGNSARARDEATDGARAVPVSGASERKPTTFPTVRVAAIQATPVILDAERCVEKAIRLLHEAADQGAQLAVLPECFVPLYPSNSWAMGAAGFSGWPSGKDTFGRGGAAVIEPTWGEVIAGPLYGEEGMVLADCDLRRGLHAKRWFDSVGHYSRQEVLARELAGAGELRR
jgi:predicted amidohydrolase